MSEPKDNRVPIMMSNVELDAVDDWRFKNRIATRSEAIRRLCQIGVLFDEKIPNIDEISGRILKISKELLAVAKRPAQEQDDKIGAMVEATTQAIRISTDLLIDASELITSLKAVSQPHIILKHHDEIDEAIEISQRAKRDWEAYYAMWQEEFKEFKEQYPSKADE